MTKRFPTMLLLALALVACGDDDGNGNGNGNGAMCTGPYASLTRDGLGQGVTGAGECTSSSDLDAVCANDITSIAGSCGVSCYTSMPDATSQELAACSTACIKQTAAQDPSDGCIGCYVQSIGCTQQNCLAQCAGGATQPGCVSCRADAGCTAGFYTCSGLPNPNPQDGGTDGGDAGGDAGDDAGGDAGDDAGTDAALNGGS